MTTIDIQHRSFEATLAACEAIGGVDLIVTSPPYPDARPGQYGGDASRDFAWSDYQRLGDHVWRALKPGGFAAVNIDGPVRFWRDKKIGSERSLIAFKLAIDWAERVGLRYVEHCAYVRDGAPGLFGDRWRSGWEPVHVFQRPGPSLADLTQARVSAKLAGTKHGRSRNRDAGGWVQSSARVHADTRCITTAIQGFINCGTTDQEHPAPFGDWLADAFVLCYSPAGGLVCDPFMGSGTVALSCVRHGRDVIGGDLGAREADGRRWADIAKERAIEIVNPTQQGLFLLQSDS